MRRRTFLQAGAAGTIVAASGCLTSLVGDDGAEHAVLEAPPEEIQPTASDNLAYPAYGEAFPHFSLPDPLSETTIDTDSLEGPFLVTAFYAYCEAECTLLLPALANAQALLGENGLDATFLAITFDPERDTPETLEENATAMRVDLEAGNWHYLRPEDDAEAEAIVAEDLGIGFERVGPDEAYDFQHITVTFLVNPDGYVERAYQTDTPDPETILEDTQTLVDNWE